jgi:hypothetical protein
LFLFALFIAALNAFMVVVCLWILFSAVRTKPATTTYHELPLLPLPQVMTDDTSNEKMEALFVEDDILELDTVFDIVVSQHHRSEQRRSEPRIIKKVFNWSEEGIDWDQW